MMKYRLYSITWIVVGLLSLWAMTFSLAQEDDGYCEVPVETEEHTEEKCDDDVIMKDIVIEVQPEELPPEVIELLEKEFEQHIEKNPGRADSVQEIAEIPEVKVFPLPRELPRTGWKG